MLSYIQLSNVGMAKIPDRNHIIDQMKLCLDNGPYKYRRYNRVMRTIADKVDVSKDDYKIEQTRLTWIIYTNINGLKR